MMEVNINGAATTVEENETLDRILTRIGIPPESTGIAVALNESVIPREKWKSTAPGPGDRVEVIHAVQGG